MTNKNIITTTLNLFFIYLLFPLSLSAQNLEKKNILLLHSYHPGMTWIENINRAVHDVLDIKKNNYVLHTEYMDTKRHNSSEYYEHLKEIYHHKYQDKNIDLILSTDNNAFNFLIKNRDQLFGDIPVIFSGVNGFEPKMLEDVTNFTGVAEQFSVKETVDIILKLHPDLKQIYIINDYLETGLAWQKDMKKALKKHEEKIKLIYSDNLSLEELKKNINAFNDDTAILMGVYFADKDKKYITYERVGTYLLGESRDPVYCLLNFNISNNVIGGKVISGYTQGEAMSKIALRVLGGTDTEDIKITYSEANEFIFNYQGTEHYKIDLSLLPSESTVINKPYSLYEDYKIILFSMIGIFFISFLILVLFLVYYKLMARTDNKNKELFLITFIRFAPIVIIPLITLLIVWILVYNANQNYEDMKAYEKEVYIEQKKNEAKREVDRFIEIAQTRLSIYNYKNVENIQKNLLTIASKIKFDISGYLIIGGMEGTMLYHPNKGLLNANLFDPQFEKEKNVYIQFKNKIDTQGKGFVKYHWTNPSSKKLEDKITYVRELPELNWYVAAGVYLDELEQHIEEKTKLNTLYDKNNLMIIAIASIILLLITIAISIGLSVFLRNIFREYRKNIILEIDKNKMIEASKKEFELLANTDSLTKIHNRFSIMKIMHNEHLYAQKNNLPLSVIMFDLDHFKDVNDHYGHDVGDDVLRDMAQVTKKHLRDNDEMGRYGGEEFIVVLPKTTIQTAKVIAERLRKEVELFEFSVVKNITISIGVIEVLKGEDEHQLFKRLDTLLYESKNKGRNRVSG